MLHIEWIDGEREPQCEPDPKFPNGVDIRCGAAKTCSTELPYPAKRCGVYAVYCDVCNYRIAFTVAGRADDPRSVQIPCNGRGWEFEKVAHAHE